MTKKAIVPAARAKSAEVYPYRKSIGLKMKTSVKAGVQKVREA